MKKHLIKILVAALAFLSVFFLIKLNKKDKEDYFQGIRPPISTMDLPFDTYVFDADKGTTIERPNGTMIRIPANAFVDSSGNKVNGKVVLKVREFHQANDIFRAGISMSTDSSRTQFLESAGMIELRAFSNSAALELEEGKEAEISLASFRNAAGYQLYHMEKDKNWIVSDTFSILKNTRKQNMLDSLQLVLTQASKQDIIFDMVTNLEDVPYLKAFDGLKWKISKKDIDDELLNAMRVNWDEVSVKPLFLSKSKYRLVFRKTMSLRDTDLVKEYQVNAIPIKNGAEITKNEMNFLYQNYDSVKLLVDAETERVKMQADLVNSFKINKMGIWNYDKLMNLNDLVYREITFNFKKQIDSQVTKMNVYAIYLDNNSVIEYAYKDWKKIGFLKNRKMQLNLILPGGKLIKIDENMISDALKKSQATLVFDTE